MTFLEGLWCVTSKRWLNFGGDVDNVTLGLGRGLLLYECFLLILFFLIYSRYFTCWFVGGDDLTGALHVF